MQRLLLETVNAVDDSRSGVGINVDICRGKSFRGDMDPQARR